MTELPKAMVIVLSARCPSAVASLGEVVYGGPLNRDLGIMKAVGCEHTESGVIVGHINRTRFLVQT